MFEYEPLKKKKEKEIDLSEKKQKQPSPNFTGIPQTMKEGFEDLSGFSFHDVRVHYNSNKPLIMQALAYTQGNQVYMAPGQQRYLPHELGHVVQQKQGRVYPTNKIQGKAINDTPELEREADNWQSRYKQYQKEQKQESTVPKVVSKEEYSSIIQRVILVSPEVPKKLQKRGKVKPKLNPEDIPTQESELVPEAVQPIPLQTGTRRYEKIAKIIESVKVTKEREAAKMAALERFRLDVEGEEEINCFGLSDGVIARRYINMIVPQKSVEPKEIPIECICITPEQEQLAVKYVLENPSNGNLIPILLAELKEVIENPKRLGIGKAELEALNSGDNSALENMYGADTPARALLRSILVSQKFIEANGFSKSFQKSPLYQCFEHPLEFVLERLHIVLKAGTFFYSFSALCDAVASDVFHAFIPTISSINDRPNQPYKTEDTPNESLALHHLMPWLELKHTQQGNRAKEESEQSLQAYCWRVGNVVAGSQDHRIFDPKSSYDVEARMVRDTSTQSLATTSEEFIKRETSTAYMRTDMLQEIFKKSIELENMLLIENFEKMEIVEKANICTALKEKITNFVTLLRLAVKRFTEIEVIFQPYSEEINSLYNILSPMQNFSIGDWNQLLLVQLGSRLRVFQRNVMQIGVDIDRVPLVQQIVLTNKTVVQPHFDMKMPGDEMEELRVGRTSQLIGSDDREVLEASSSRTPSKQVHQTALTGAKEDRAEEGFNEELLLENRIIICLRKYFGEGIEIYNPSSDGNNCLFGAVLGKERAGIEQEIRQQLRQQMELAHMNIGTMEDGEMIDETALSAMFEYQEEWETSIAQRILGITGIQMFTIDMRTGVIQPAGVMGEITESSPRIVCLGQAHYIRIIGE